MSPRLKKIIVLALVAAIAVVAITLVVSLRHRRSSEIITIQDAGTIIRHGYDTSHKDESLLLSTNRNLIKYDPVTGSTEALMNDGLLPEIPTVIWSPNQSKALILSSGQTTNDTLGSLLEQQKKQSSANVWWVADFTTKTYSPLDIQASNAGWVNDSTVYAVGNPTGKDAYGLYIANTATLNLVQVLRQADILNAYPVKDGFLLYSSVDRTGVLSKVSSRGGSAQTIITHLTQAPQLDASRRLGAAMIDKSGKVPDDADLTPGDLVVFDTSSGKTLATLAKKQAQSGTWATAGETFYFMDNSSHSLAKTTFMNNQPKTVYLKPEKKPSWTISSFTITPKGTLYLRNEAKHLYIASTTDLPHVPTTKTDQVNGDVGFEGDGFSIYYYRSTNVYGISVTGEPRATYRQKALDYLRSKGVNPDLVDIVYDYEYTPVTSGVPVESGE